MVDCNDCQLINITEEVQTDTKVDHVCTKYKERLLHKANSPKHDRYIYPCRQCRGNSFKEREINKPTWSYELYNRDVWSAEIFDSRDEAINAAIEVIKMDDRARKKLIELAKQGALVNIRMPITEFKIGMCVHHTVPSIDIDSMLENIDDNYHDEAGECADEAYLFDKVTKEQQNELDEALNDVFYKWLEKNDIKPDTYKIENEETIKIDDKYNIKVKGDNYEKSR